MKKVTKVIPTATYESVKPILASGLAKDLRLGQVTGGNVVNSGLFIVFKQQGTMSIGDEVYVPRHSIVGIASKIEETDK